MNDDPSKILQSDGHCGAHPVPYPQRDNELSMLMQKRLPINVERSRRQFEDAGISIQIRSLATLSGKEPLAVAIGATIASKR
jgi:hypothetical protein